MARSHLTLAALATSAVAGLDLAATSTFGGNGAGDYDSALLTGRDGRHWLIRIPTSEAAEEVQAADAAAIRALSPGIRSRLPFAVSTFAGEAPVGSTRAVVYEFVYGHTVSGIHELDAGDRGLAASVGRAIAAIHNLPTSFIADAGLPVLAPAESRRSAITIMDRAAATGLVPVSLTSRWEKAIEDSALWQFQPTVINNALGAASLLTADGSVAGILGWQDLRVADPARDLAWLLGARAEGATDSAFEAYLAIRPGDRQVTQRAVLYAELEIAKWLLHGTETRSTEIVDDAVEMLGALVDSLENDVMHPIGAQTMPSMAVDEVEEFLQRSERAV